MMNRPGTDRRRFLGSALAAGAFAAARGAGVPAFAADDEKRRRFVPVRVARERLIRTVVGLRPYRAEGFVVSAERAGEKLLVHNYGHGGAGVTLSWGTAALATELARGQGDGRFAVVGCGVSGLTTARLLQRRGGAVTIYAREMPPETTSNVAGALWLPTSSYHPQRVSAAWLEQFRAACDVSNRAFQLMAGTEYGVRWMETFSIHTTEESAQSELLGGARLYPETKIHRDSKRYFGEKFVRQFNTMLIEPSVYLNALVRDFYVAGGKVVVKEFRGREEVAALAEPVVFNCAGLGARALFGDEALVPVRGQLEVLLPQPEVDYCLLHGSYYMFPRRDGVILGGTFERGNWSLAPDAETTERILGGNAELMKHVRR